MTYVITLHGVLQQPNGAPNPQGIALYGAFVDIGRVAVLGGLNREKDEWFLGTHNLTDHVDYVPELVEKSPTELGRRLAQIGTLRGKGTRVEIVVEPDPEVITALHEQGVPTLMYLHPAFSQPAFRPDYESVARPWATLVETVQYQEALKAAQVFATPGDEEDEEDYDEDDA